jgi:hypothetical protein
MAFGDCVDFNEVFHDEIDIINKRRAKARPRRRPKIELKKLEQEDSAGRPIFMPKAEASVVGLALSGGGIRSSAFCLGALQALAEAKILDKVDYLSTVSGGGYIGCSLSAGLEATHGQFPFDDPNIANETPSMQHVRDFSDYLFPDGAIDVLQNVSIYVRGLVANFILVMPFLLVAAALTLLSNPTVDSLSGARGIDFLDLTHFIVTVYLASALFVLIVVWSLVRSRFSQQGSHEIIYEPKWRLSWTRVVGWAVLIVLASAFCELQTFVLAAMFHQSSHNFFKAVAGSINTLVAILTPIGTAIAFFGHKLAEFIKAGTESAQTQTKIVGIAARSAVYFAALVVPLLLWAVYLDLAYWGISPDGFCRGCTLFGLPRGDFVAGIYILIGAFLFVLSLLLRPNANSLHPLYRDRLSKAFLFKPLKTSAAGKMLDSVATNLTDLSGAYGPYHLINAALNVQNSSSANKRGRNADFFIFSPAFVGSEATGYVATGDYSRMGAKLDLATAMAVSGAAASSNMGNQSIKPLTATLALLNIRLGYWLRNPREVKHATVVTGSQRPKGNPLANYYFLAELFGLLSESRKSVYLTDGGHIENLGIYELLKRRCRVIIAVDAEADPEMAFGSFNSLARYARLDHGLEIDLPWQQIAKKSKDTGEAIDDTNDAEKSHGPHCAIGRITDSDGRKSVLIYIKSSLTGDENDYVFDYKRRYSAFPHESTLDQMFTEEQFEAYRALGYHAANGLFDRRDDFAKLDPVEFPDAADDIALLDELFPRAMGDTQTHRERFIDWLPTDPVKVLIEGI